MAGVGIQKAYNRKVRRSWQGTCSQSASRREISTVGFPVNQSQATAGILSLVAIVPVTGTQDITIIYIRTICSSVMF